MIDTEGNNSFATVEIGGLLMSTNLWGVDLSRNDAYCSWTLAAGSQINDNAYEAPSEGESGPSIMSWRIQDTVFYSGCLLYTSPSPRDRG